MLPTARRIRLWLMTLLQSSQAGIMAILESLRAGPWAHSNYQLLEGAREKSYHFYARTTKRTWSIACWIAAVIFLFWCFPLLPINSSRVANERLCDHPISILASEASETYNATVRRQSKSLDEAVTEYRRRYGMPPPPHFDKWYDFAKQRNTMLIDEYDTVYHSLLPFWGTFPKYNSFACQGGPGLR